MTQLPARNHAHTEGYLAKKCAVKAAGLQPGRTPAPNRFAPPGSNRGGNGGGTIPTFNPLKWGALS